MKAGRIEGIKPFSTDVETITLSEVLDLITDMSYHVSVLCESLEKVKSSLEQNGSLPLWKKQGFDSMFLSLQRFSLKKCDIESWAKTAMIKAKE